MMLRSIYGIWIWLWVVLVLWEGSSGLRGEDGAARPNVILIMADDLGWGDVGFNGNTEVLTPHLDGLANDGIRLERFYAQAPSCSPTRASCLTGRNGYRFGVPRANNGRLEPEELSLAEILAEAGYATGHFGKWHLGTLTRTVRDGNRGGREKGVGMYAPPWENGYEVAFATESKVPTWDPMIRPDNDVRTYWLPQEEDMGEARWVSYVTRYWTGEERWAQENLSGDDSRVMVDRVIPFLEGALESGRPFFVTIWFHAPHLPVVASAEHREPYARFGPYKQHYYGCITAMDEQVGRLRGFLEERGVAENTPIFFCSDNGPETIPHPDGQPPPGSAGPWSGAKRSLLEGGVRVPGLVYWPAGLEGGRSSALPMCTSDYLPTILAACGIEYPEAGRPLDGMNVLDSLRSGREERGRPIPFRFLDQLALTGDRYKLYTDDAGTSYQLFDLERDPGETVDVSESQLQLVAAMRKELEAWVASCRSSAAGLDY